MSYLFDDILEDNELVSLDEATELFDSVEEINEGYVNMMRTFFDDVAESNVLLYKMQVAEESAVLEGVEVVTEASFKEYYNKLIVMFKKLGESFKKWWTSIVEYLKNAFDFMGKFVKENKEELMKKEHSEFVYKGHKFKEMAAGRLIKDAHSKAVTYMRDVESKLGEAIVELELKDLISFEDMGEFKKNVRETLMNTEKPEEIKGFSFVGVADMIKYIEAKRKKLDDYKKVAAEHVKDINTIIGDLKKAQSKDDKEYTANLKKNISSMKLCLSVHKTTLNLDIEIVKTVAKEYYRVLKSFSSWKPAKESSDLFDLEL